MHLMVGNLSKNKQNNYIAIWLKTYSKHLQAEFVDERLLLL